MILGYQSNILVSIEIKKKLTMSFIKVVRYTLNLGAVRSERS